MESSSSSSTTPAAAAKPSLVNSSPLCWRELTLTTPIPDKSLERILGHSTWIDRGLEEEQGFGCQRGRLGEQAGRPWAKVLAQLQQGWAEALKRFG
jgi:hypothetical protein